MLSAYSTRSVRGRGAARMAVATFVSGLLAAGVAMVGAGTAAADDTAPDRGGATATIGDLKTYGDAVIHDTDGDLRVPAGLFEMSVEGGGTLQTYCVDLYNPTQKGAKYHETDWSGTALGANKGAGKIRWILQNSYPQVNDLAALAAAAGTGAGLTEQDAAAGTQVAIWRYSDDVDVDAVDPQAEKLADYLERSARAAAEPEASLTVDPPAVSGRPGERIGPVTVHTNAAGATVIPPADAAASGVRIVDADGKEVTSAVDGSRIWFDVPEDAAAGSVELTVQASTTVPVGRAFASESRSQTLILAGSSESTVSATADATWAERGAIPALSAERNCSAGGLDVTVANEGDQDFTFDLLGTEYSVAATESRTVTVPLQEDQAYDFTIKGPDGLEKRFNGVLDCRTRSSETGTQAQTYSDPSPATVVTPETDVNLAETGGSAVTPLIAGTAIGLVLIGGAALVLVRKKETSAQD
ncbi:Cys-Gln thioester bond-forming surface protein [Streptomyces sp. NPDC047072]|uniref:Cys-Gln thioester bond-forming surface protein n=1 Tax=Streptomyces sp. NPDC047072 TaxID=3154809 RepID=UPI0033C64269